MCVGVCVGITHCVVAHFYSNVSACVCVCCGPAELTRSQVPHATRCDATRLGFGSTNAIEA